MRIGLRHIVSAVLVSCPAAVAGQEDGPGVYDFDGRGFSIMLPEGSTARLDGHGEDFAVFEVTLADGGKVGIRLDAFDDAESYFLIDPRRQIATVKIDVTVHLVIGLGQVHCREDEGRGTCMVFTEPVFDLLFGEWDAVADDRFPYIFFDFDAAYAGEVFELITTMRPTEN